ncbi:helix-hairpin-helix domain-containing protein [Candidatus Woesebacteria bacterium]|nr:helix-hairpin-helix domain-containing protein [Candidatus Woesebacteria bacterium]
MNIVESLHTYGESILERIPRVLKRYGIELTLIVVSGIVTIVSLVQPTTPPGTVQGVTDEATKTVISPSPAQEKSERAKVNTVFVDVSGAVNDPGVYEASAGARFSDLIEMAGGISYEADKLFVGRNFNMARMVGDQDKIYVPFTWDIALGTFTEEKRILEYLQPLYPGTELPVLQTKQQESSELIDGISVSLNEATQGELESLPGIGPVTAKKIVDNRPYIAIEELVEKKVMNQSGFEKIKEFVEL